MTNTECQDFWVGYHFSEPPKRSPLYAIISYTGGTWTVQFEFTDCDNGTTITSSCTGYGGIEKLIEYLDGKVVPIINYHNNENVCKCLSVPDSIRPIAENPNCYSGSLNSYLEFISNQGVEILNW